METDLSIHEGLLTDEGQLQSCPFLLTSVRQTKALNSGFRAGALSNHFISASVNRSHKDRKLSVIMLVLCYPKIGQMPKK